MRQPISECLLSFQVSANVRELISLEIRESRPIATHIDIAERQPEIPYALLTSRRWGILVLKGDVVGPGRDENLFSCRNP